MNNKTILTNLIIIGVCATSAVAQLTYRIQANNTVAITGYEGTTNTLTIPNYLEGRTVTTIDENAFVDQTFVNVTLPSRLTTIGNHAFNGNTLLRTCNLPNTLLTIGDYAFYNCTNLDFTNQTSTLPPSLNYVGNSAFENCTALTHFTLAPLSRYLGTYAFYGCSSLTNVDFSSATNLLTLKAGTFGACTALVQSDTSLQIPTSLTKIEESAFQDCTALIHFALPPQLDYLGQYTFAGCYNLTEINLPLSLTRIEPGTFDGCRNLATPNQQYPLPTYLQSIGERAFQYCTNLTSVSFPPSLRHIDNLAFVNCNHITQLDFSHATSLQTIGSLAFYGCLEFQPINPVWLPANLKSLKDGAFENCPKITTLILPSTLTNLGNHSFAACTQLRHLSLEKSQITTLSTLAFFGCTSLSQISPLPPSLTTLAPQAFGNCRALTNFNLSAEITLVASNTFIGCQNLANITADPANNTYTSYEGALYLRNPLSLQICPPGKSGDLHINPATLTIAPTAFTECNQLHSLTVPNIPSLPNLTDCTQLQAIYFPGNPPTTGSLTNLKQLTCYYLPNTTGWNTTLAGRPTALWNPTVTELQTDNVTHTTQFTLTGPNSPIITEITSDLAKPQWIAASTNIPNGSIPVTLNYNSPHLFLRQRSP